MAQNNRFCNDHAMITFLTKTRNRRTTPVSTQTLNNIKDAIIYGVEKCRRRETDIDMFVVIQGNRCIPNSRSIGITGVEGASMTASSDGSLKIVTHEGNHCLHVMFIGGGSSWVLADQDSDDSYDVEGLTQATR